MIGDNCWGSKVHFPHQGFVPSMIGMQRVVSLTACSNGIEPTGGFENSQAAFGRATSYEKMI